MKLPKIKFPKLSIKNLIYRLVLSPTCRELIRSWKENGGDWSYDDYWLKNKKSGINLWVGNGRFFLDIASGNDTSPGLIGIFERHLVWHEFKKILRHSKKSLKQKQHDEVIKKLKISAEPKPEPVNPPKTTGSKSMKKETV